MTSIEQQAAALPQGGHPGRSVPHPRYGDVPRAYWSDWRWQLTHRLRTADELATVLPLSAEEREAIARTADQFLMALTPYYASLIDPNDPNDPIRRQAVPQLAELVVAPGELSDPLAEESHMPVPGLTHRYPDRVLLYASHNCPVYCRHCNRRRKVGDPESAPDQGQLAKAIAYIARHAEVRDVLVSGGDPLSLSDERLGQLLQSLRAIPHLELIRLATRNPVTLPQRVTPELCATLARFHPIFVSTHFNHERECTAEAALALTRLADAGCVLSNQMVLLAGVNDEPPMVKRMNQWLLRHRCRPYYIFQADAVQGTSHFRTPLESGFAILRALRGWTSGLAVPHYVVDLPQGGGKVAVQPDALVARDGKTLTFTNYRGEPFEYIEG